MPRFAGLPLIVVLLSQPVAFASAHEPISQLRAQTDVILTAVDHVRAGLPADLDVRMASWIGAAAAPYGRRQEAPERAVSQRGEGQVRVVDMPTAKPCACDDGSHPIFCRLIDIDALIVAAEPEMHGDAATIVVSAERNTDAAFPQSQTVIRRVHLRRGAGGWAVVGIQVMRQSD